MSEGASQPIEGYELIRKLGEGGMGATYLARQVFMDRMVAIKVLRRSLAADPNFLERFYREARLAGRLDHINIVRAIDVGQSGAFHYIVMDYVEGRNAGEMLVERRALDEAEALEIVLQVARALDYAHCRGILHRDVKPDNILVDGTGTVRLCDFGLARQTDSELRLTREGMAVGTASYVSPEQARGERNADVRSDIYSLGVTLFHLITGQVPYTGDSAMAVLSKHLNEPVPWARDINPLVSEGCCRLVEKMMAKDPAQRHQTPGELIAELEEIAAGPEPPAGSGEEPAAEPEEEPPEPETAGPEEETDQPPETADEAAALSRNPRTPPARRGTQVSLRTERLGLEMFLSGRRRIFAILAALLSLALGLALGLFMGGGEEEALPLPPPPGSSAPPTPPPGQPPAPPPTPPAPTPADRPPAAYTAVWTKVAPKGLHSDGTAGPLPMGGEAFGTAYDSKRNFCVLYGGNHNGPQANDLWAFDATKATWTCLLPGDPAADGTSRPKPAEVTGFAYDRERDCYWMHPAYGPLWSCDARTLQWKAHAPLGKGIVGLLVLPPSNRIVALASRSYQPLHVDLPDSAPRKGSLPPVTDGRACLSLAPGPDGRVMLFGGVSHMPGSRTYHADTWLYDAAGDKWLQARADPAPPGRANSNLAYNLRIGGWVLFGGEATPPGGERPSLGDVWVYDPGRRAWSQAESSTAPQSTGAFWYDEARDVHVLFRGRPSSAETWTLRIEPK